MATNQVYSKGDELIEPVASGVLSGAPVVVGQMPGVAQTDRDANGNASVDFDGVYNLSVKGINAGGNTAIAYGDILYYTTGDTPPISAKATGVRFGYARGAVTSGATATIAVKLGY
jgi:predicted RecA/RadA family phage recombinase